MLTFLMEVLRKRVSLSSAIAKLTRGKWLSAVLWINAKYEDVPDDNVDRVAQFVHQRKLKSGIVVKDGHNWSLFEKDLSAFKEKKELQGRLKVVIALDSRLPDELPILTDVLAKLDALQLPLEEPPMIYISFKKIDDYEAITAAKKAFLTVIPTARVSLNRESVRKFCAGATMIRIGDHYDSANDLFLELQGVKVIQKSTVHGALEYLEEERTMLLRPHNDLLRIMTHVSDGLFLDAVSAVTDVPILVYGTDEHISINMIRRIYDHPRSRYAIDQGEIFEFAFMRFLDWAPSLHGGICLSRNGNEEIIAEDGVLTVEAISCKDLYPKDSNGLSDPYVVVKRVSGSGSDFKSDVQYKTLNPIWTDLNWQIPVNNTEELRIVVWDYDKLTNHDFEGEAYCAVDELLREMPLSSCRLLRTYRLLPKKKKLKKNKIKDDGRPPSSPDDSSEGSRKSAFTSPRSGAHKRVVSANIIPELTKKERRLSKRLEKKEARRSTKVNLKDLNSLLINETSSKSGVQLEKDSKFSFSPEGHSPAASPVSSPKGRLPGHVRGRSSVDRTWSSSDGSRDDPHSQSTSKRILKAFGGHLSPNVSGTITLLVSWESIRSSARADSPKHFGVPLPQSLRTAKEDGQEHIAIQICNYLELNGTQQVGIFRIPGNTPAMKKMQEIIDRGQHVVLEDFKILDVAALLKAYCRALPDSLIPQTSWHYLENLKCMKDTAGEYDEESGWKDVETLQRIFKMGVPPENLVVFKVIIHCLAEIAACSDVNKMTSSNLATCLAPTLLIRVAGNDLDFLAKTQVANKVLTFIIDWAWDIFDFKSFAISFGDESDSE